MQEVKPPPTDYLQTNGGHGAFDDDDEEETLDSKQPLLTKG